MDFHVLIPARYQSVRLPGKPLLKIAGKPMIEHVYRRAAESGANSVTVATDDERIAEAVLAFGGEVCMTDIKHRSGTERLAEAVKLLGFSEQAIVVNVQGDEPLIPPAIINQVATNLDTHTAAKVATLCTPILNSTDLFNTNIVKVVRDRNDYAIYFSRAAIPWDRDNFNQTNKSEHKLSQNYFRHLGIYAYRVEFIHRYLSWESSALEDLECLEQLRTLWYGEKIHVATAVEIPAQDVNCEEDLVTLKKYFD